MFGRNQRQMTQRVDAGATIARLFCEFRGPPESGLCLVGVARSTARTHKCSRRLLGGRRFPEIEGDRPATLLERRGNLCRLERVNRAQHDNLSADGIIIGRGSGLDCLNPLGGVIELTQA